METVPPDLRVDLTSIDDIKAQLPGLEQTVREKHHAAVEAQEEFDAWVQLVQRLKALAGLVFRFEAPDGPYVTPLPSGAEDAVVRVVEMENRAIMPMGVAEVLLNEGHEVESPIAVLPVLISAAENGRILRLDQTVFAPIDLPPEDQIEFSMLQEVMQAVPEAHLGLEAPSPESRTEAVLRILGTAVFQPWTTQMIAEVMAEQGWMPNDESTRASIASTLSRLVADGRIHRLTRGQYQLAPPNDDAEDDSQQSPGPAEEGAK
jgi:hypothetical protein